MTRKRIGQTVAFIFGFSAAILPAAHAQKSTVRAASPSHVPPEIQAAKTVFISNAGGGCDPFTPRPYNRALDADRAYEQFYDAVQKWGRYQITASPREAELDFEISLPCPPTPNSVNHGASWVWAPADPQFRLVIRDIGSRIVLWVITEHIEDSDSAGGFEKSWARNMQALLSRLKGLAPGTASSAGQPTQGPKQ